MKQYQGRNTDLKNRINSHLSKLTGIHKDYYSGLDSSDLLELKTVLADIHNVLTLKMTNAAAKWLCRFFEFDKNTRKEVLENIDKASPNQKGFDIHIEKPYKIVAEVKCISPVNEGNRFGAAQRNAILDDLSKLKNGKESVPDTSLYYKFLFMIDLGERTEQAILALLKESKIRIEKSYRIERNEIKKYVRILSHQKPVELNVKDVYLKTLPMSS